MSDKTEAVETLRLRMQRMVAKNDKHDTINQPFTSLRGAMPDEVSVIVLMGKTAMDKESYRRVIPRMREERVLFPNG